MTRRYVKTEKGNGTSNGNITDTGKYDQLFSNDSHQKGTRGLNSNGEPSIKGVGHGIKSNGLTDPNSAITKISFPIRGEIYSINFKGELKEGELKIKTEIMYDEEGKYLGKKQFVALDDSLGSKSDWSKTSETMIIDNYRKSQITNCIERKSGWFYSQNLKDYTYSEFIKISSEDKTKALKIIGFDEETSNKLLEEILNSSGK